MTELPEVTETRTVLTDICLPRDIVPGAVLMHDGEPMSIIKVERISDPWTARPSLLATIDSVRKLVFLILTCSSCKTQLAAPYGLKQEELDWLELRWHGVLYWLCTECLNHQSPNWRPLIDDLRVRYGLS